MRPNGQTVQTKIAQAEQQLARGLAKEAVATLQPLALAFPKDTRVQLLAARAHRDTGDTERALARYKAAASTSRHAGLWREFVTELLRAGQKGRARKEAAKCPLRPIEKKALVDFAKAGIRTASAASGGVAEEELDAVKTLMNSGRVEDAVARAEQLLETNPTSAFLHNVLGIAALADNRAADAEERFRKTLELSPDFSGAEGNLGLALMAQSKLDEAITSLGAALIRDPRSVAVRTNLASAHLKKREFEEAAEHAGKLLQQAPDDVEGLQILVAALNKLRRHEDAFAPLERLLEMAPSNQEALRQKMFALEGCGKVEEALMFAEKYADVAPELARIQGDLLAQTGRLEEAATRLASVIDANPDDANAYMSYGGLARWREDDPVLEKLRKFAQSSDQVRQKGLGFYALAKAETDLGLDDAAFETLRKANAAHASSASRSYNPDQMDRDVERIAAIWDDDAIAELAKVGAETVRPVFVIGMPRSGSTLLDQILCAHPEHVGVGEDSVVSRYFPLDLDASKSAIEFAAREGAAALRKASTGGKQVVDKFLFNFLRVGPLAAAFPRARFICTVRDPRSVALSIYSNPMKVDGHPYSTNLEHIARFYLSYEKMMAHWRAVLPDRLCPVTYERLVADPETEIRALIDWLGLPWNDACLKPDAVARRVKTLSVTQVRSEISTKSVDKWKRFESGLAPFIDVLRDAGHL